MHKYIKCTHIHTYIHTYILQAVYYGPDDDDEGSVLKRGPFSVCVHTQIHMISVIHEMYIHTYILQAAYFGPDDDDEGSVLKHGPGTMYVHAQIHMNVHTYIHSAGRLLRPGRR
jgi:hypothetical protein